MRTRLCDLLGIEAPVVLAPMGGAVTPRLAAAVSNAGALGMLPLTWTAPDEVAGVVGETAQLTDCPFGVNLGLAWDQRERLAAVLAAGVRIVSFFWGDASSVSGEAREAGAIVLPPSAPRRKVEPRRLRAPMSSSRRAGRRAVTSGGRFRHSRSCPG